MNHLDANQIVVSQCGCHFNTLTHINHSPNNAPAPALQIIWVHQKGKPHFQLQLYRFNNGPGYIRKGRSKFKHVMPLWVQVALQGSAMDPTTGTIDMDLIQTGISAGDRTARAQLTQELRSLIQRETLLMLLSQLPSRASHHFCRHAACCIS